MTPNASKQGKFGSLGAIFLFICLPCMWGLGPNHPVGVAKFPNLCDRRPSPSALLNYLFFQVANPCESHFLEDTANFPRPRFARPRFGLSQVRKVPGKLPGNFRGTGATEALGSRETFPKIWGSLSASQRHAQHRSGNNNHAFGKPCLCPRDARHFRHFRCFHGVQAAKPLFYWLERKFVFFAIFVKTSSFWQGAKA